MRVLVFSTSTRYFCQILMKRKLFSIGFSKNLQVLNIINIRRVGTELLHADERTDGHDEGKNRFSQFASAPKNNTDAKRTER